MKTQVDKLVEKYRDRESMGLTIEKCPEMVFWGGGGWNVLFCFGIHLEDIKERLNGVYVVDHTHEDKKGF